MNETAGSATAEAAKTATDERVLGTYEGDGAFHTIRWYARHYDSHNLKTPPSKSFVYFATWFVFTLGWVTNIIIVLTLAGVDWVHAPGFMYLMVFPLGTILLGILFFLDRHYWHARFRLGACEGYAMYWQENDALRFRAVQPRNRQEFLELITLASRRDQELTRVYLAETAAKQAEELFESYGYELDDARAPDLATTLKQYLQRSGDGVGGSN